jgi:hypothetical protein
VIRSCGRGVALAALVVGCSKREPEPPPRLPAPIPADYPLPAGERLTDEARLGRKASFIFTYGRPGAAVLDDLAAALEAAGWPADRAAGKVATERGDLRLVASADGDTVLIDAIAAAPPADARPPRPPPLDKPPPGYPPGFPFIAGGIPEPVRGAPAAAIGLVYPKKTAKTLAVALRRGAERSRWMCTQEPLEFVCANAPLSVDVRLSDRRGEAVLLMIPAGP